jgi:2-polyprenyl-3-methyl-5-hydroxy-6-metoxy-1,4-benzoquinol methylase
MIAMLAMHVGDVGELDNVYHCFSTLRKSRGDKVTRISNAENIRAWESIPAQLIEGFGDEGDFARQHLLTPAILRMLGDVGGKSILDAGCGQGYLCRLLAKQGAHVTGVEPAAAQIEYAIRSERNDRLGITYIQEDLSILRLNDRLFDAVVANMVLIDIPDYHQAMLNCVRYLKAGGSLIFSLIHPCFEGPDSEYSENGFIAVTEYFAENSIEQTYGYRFHRTLSQYLNMVIQCGCRIAEIVEPQLDARFEQQDRIYARNVHVPAFIIVHAVNNEA